MKMNSEHTLRWLVRAGLLSGPLLGVFWPEALEPQVATRLLPAVLHSFTLGVFVPLFIYRLTQENLGLKRLTPWISLLLAVGLSGFLIGLLSGNRWFFYLGGHYAAPSALYLLSLQAGVGAWKGRKTQGLHQLGWISFGLFVAANLGGMLVLDRFYGGKYGFYSPHAVLAHGSGAVFLFLFPFLAHQVNQAKALKWVLGVGSLSYAGYLVGWLSESPWGFGVACCGAALLMLFVAFGDLGVGAGAKLQKVGWIVASIVAGLTPFAGRLAVLPNQWLLGLGLYLFLGLSAPLLVTKSGIFGPGSHRTLFVSTAIGVGGMLGLLGAAGLPLVGGFVAYGLLWAWWLLPRKTLGA